MDPPETQNDNISASTTNTRRVIQPINPEEVKAFVGENKSPIITEPIASPIQRSSAFNYGVSNQTVSQASEEEEWRPRGTLASRIPALRNYGIVLVIGSILFMYLNRTIWKFSHQSSGRILGIVIYAVLGVILVSGIIILLSKSKVFVLLCLNIIIGLSLLVGLLSLLSLNIISIIFTVMVIGSVVNIKQYVKRAD